MEHLPELNQLPWPPEPGMKFGYCGHNYHILKVEPLTTRNRKNEVKTGGFTILSQRVSDKQIATHREVSLLAHPETPVLKPQNDGVTVDIGYHMSLVTPQLDLEYEVGGKNRPLLISIDAEYYLKDGKVIPLSHQFSIKMRREYYSMVVVYQQEKPLTPQQSLSLFLETTKELTGFDPNNKKPFHITAISHYGSGDWAIFNKGSETFKYCDQVRNAPVTIEKPLYLRFIDKNRHAKRNLITEVRDSYLLSPGTSGALKSLGIAVKKDKIEVEQHYKEHMNELLLLDPYKFLTYGILDTEIPLDWCEVITGGENMPIPTTLGGLGAKAFKAAMCELLGYKTPDFDLNWRGLETHTTREKMPDGSLRKTSKLLTSPNYAFIEGMATKAYMGGRNECFAVGLHRDDWRDFDLAGAYPTAMGLIEDPDYSDPATTWTGKIKKGFIHPSMWIFGFFKFKFPDTVMYPCLPVKDREGRGLIFPLEGETYATGPELYLALELGAEIEIVGTAFIQGTKRQKTMGLAMKGLIAKRLEAVKNHGKGSPQELMSKEVASSVYGKLAQGLAGKTGYNPRTDNSKLIPPSSITSAPQAALITSFVRATVSAAMNQLHELGFSVLSVTTDGFITNATQEVIAGLDLYGFQGLMINSRYEMAGSHKIWELKHSMEVAVMVTTRGGYGLSSDPEDIPVCATAGYSVFGEDLKDETRISKIKHCVKAYFKRIGRVETGYKKAPTVKQYRRGKTSGAFVSVEKTISMEFDFKRNVLDESVTTELIEVDDELYEVLSYITKPWKTMQDFCDARAVMKDLDGIAIKSESTLENVVKRIGYKSKLRAGNVRVQGNDLNRTIAIGLLRGLRSGELKCPSFDGLIGTAIAMRVGEAYGVVLGADDWKNAGRKSRSGRTIGFDSSDTIALGLGFVKA